MFLVSGPDLIVETCRSGLVGTFPALNQRTSDGYSEWLNEISSRLTQTANAAPFGVNLIVHKTNARLQQDIEITIRHKVPIVITSLGAVPDVVAAIHSYGGLVFHDVINTHHAHKAATAGVDGLIAVCAGAGGHAGLLNPFAFVAEIRQFFDQLVVLSGSITNGRQIAAARILGADLAYLGTRFINTREALAPHAYKEMIIAAEAKDIVYTAAISGIHANFLRASVPENPPAGPEAKIWKEVWSAGHGVGSIHDIPSVAELCQRLSAEYREALSQFKL